MVPEYLIGTDEIAFMSTLASSSGLFSPKGAFTHAAHLGLSFSIPQLSCITANVYLACKVHLSVRITSKICMTPFR